MLAAILLLLKFISYTGAIDYYITSPYDAISWTIGKEATVTWNILPGGPVIESINVDLMDGNDMSANVVCNIATGLPPSATSATWVVPNNLMPGKTYFVRIASPSLSVQRYSHRFSIVGTCSIISSVTPVSSRTSQTSSSSIGTSFSTSAKSSSSLTKTITDDEPNTSLLPRTKEGNLGHTPSLTGIQYLVVLCLGALLF